MGCMRCCTILIAVVAISIGVLYYHLDNNIELSGTMPFLLKQQNIFEDRIPDLTGKVMVVTGANVGLGRSTVKHLVSNGATVIMACRSDDKCFAAKKRIILEVEKAKGDNKLDYSKFSPNNLKTMNLDLASFESIKQFYTNYKKDYKYLHSLILNAGIAMTPFKLTRDGIEQQIGVNHFGHFYLTKLFLPLLEKSQPSTIVSVSSYAHTMSYDEGVRLSLKAINDESTYDPSKAYGQSKLANVFFVQELSERLRKDGKNIYVNAVHPGAVNTELAREQPEFGLWLLKKFCDLFPNTLFWESDPAALAEVYAAVSPDIFEKKLSGKYIVPLGQVIDVNDCAKKPELQKKFWDFTEKVLKIKKAV